MTEVTYHPTKLENRFLGLTGLDYGRDVTQQFYHQGNRPGLFRSKMHHSIIEPDVRLVFFKSTGEDRKTPLEKRLANPNFERIRLSSGSSTVSVKALYSEEERERYEVTVRFTDENGQRKRKRRSFKEDINSSSLATALDHTEHYVKKSLVNKF